MHKVLLTIEERQRCIDERFQKTLAHDVTVQEALEVKNDLGLEFALKLAVRALSNQKRGLLEELGSLQCKSCEEPLGPYERVIHPACLAAMVAETAALEAAEGYVFVPREPYDLLPLCACGRGKIPRDELLCWVCQADIMRTVEQAARALGPPIEETREE